MHIQNRLNLAFIVTCIGASHVSASVQAQEISTAKTQAVSNALAAVAPSAALHPGDHLRITVISDDKNLSGEFEVAPDGTLRHPLYNRVQVAGVPVTDLKDSISSFLKALQKEPQLEVEPLFQITVTGEVNKPGVFFVAPETTLQKAIEREAAGANDRADLNAITLLRDSRRIPVSLAEVSPANAPQTVRSGDYITVRAKRNVMGNITPFLGIGASIISLTVLIVSHHR